MPTRYGVTVLQSSNVFVLKKALSAKCGMPVAVMNLCDVYQNNVYEILSDKKQISSISAEDVLVVYEVDLEDENAVHVICTNALVDPDVTISPNELLGDRDLFGYPFLTSFDANLSCKEIWDYIWVQVRRFMDKDDDDKRDDRLGILRIRALDPKGKPRLAFRDEENDEVDASILPANSNKPLSNYLGSECGKQYMLLRLEWTRHVEEASSSIVFDEERFSEVEDHSSLFSAIKQQQASKKETKGVTLDECFDTFTRPERLDEDNMWYCSNCKTHVRALKTMELWRLPNVLVLHLKRFEFKNTYRREKLETFVDCPLEGLDMNKYCAANDPKYKKDIVDDSVPATYDLFGVTNHYGRMGFGHYTAFARRWNEHTLSKEWVLFDDANVRTVGNGLGGPGEERVVTPAAYVLFYRRRVFS